MPDKLIKLGQEEVDKIVKRKPNMNEAIKLRKLSELRRHIGIKRLPDTNEINHAKVPQQPLSTIMGSKTNNNLNNVAKTEPIIRPTMDINLDQSMSKSIEEALFYQALKISHPNKKEIVKTKSNIASSFLNEECNDSSILKVSTSVQSETSSTYSNDSDDLSIVPSAITNLQSMPLPKPLKQLNCLNVQSPFKITSFKDAQLPRKMVEVENRQKKELLRKTTGHNSKSNSLEAHRIKEIKKQVIKLNDDFATDVAVLRKKVDRVCIYFNIVEQEYIKTEKKFVKCKLDLREAAEKQEILAEQLGAVITRNENRKVEKLTDRVEKTGSANRASNVRNSSPKINL
uniref:RAB6-interacting golgin n=1 Tax=Glossina austeni TaxID=7395 RepID=A0A1A9VYT5_GLOAU